MDNAQIIFATRSGFTQDACWQRLSDIACGRSADA